MSDHYKESSGNSSSTGRKKKSKSSSSKSSSSVSLQQQAAAAAAAAAAPKGILKNSDPYAPYHHNKKNGDSLEELFENERPRSASREHSSSGHSHRHHGHSSSGTGSRDEKHHKKHRSKSSSERAAAVVEDEDADANSVVEEKNRRNHKHHHGSGSTGSSKRHRSSKDSDESSSSKHGSSKRSGSSGKKRSSKHSSSSGAHHSSNAESATGDLVDIDNDEGVEHDDEHAPPAAEEVSGSARRRRRRRSRSPPSHQPDAADAADAASAIYDQPKVPAVKYMHTNESSSAENYDSEEVSRIYKAIVQAAEANHSNGEGGGGGGEEQGFYENLGYNESKSDNASAAGPGSSNGIVITIDELNGDDEDPALLYDIPRNNKPVEFLDEEDGISEDLGDESEVIYVNENGVELDVDDNDVDPDDGRGLKPLSELIPQDYDVPKIRDSLSTIEEEHQEYDIPRSNPTPVLGSAVDSAIYSATSDDTGLGEASPPPPPKSPDADLYQNQGFAVINSHHQKSPPVSKIDLHHNNGPTLYNNDARAYLNEFTAVANVNSHAGSSHAGSSNGDDRSSGYRSSSSPSIQSTEELYVNESAVVSMEADLDSCGSSHKHSSPEPNTRDIAIETTLERHKDTTKTKSKSKEKGVKEERKKREKEVAKETAREKERARAEEIEREIRKKREESNRFQKPLDFFNRKSKEEKKNSPNKKSKKTKSFFDEEDVIADNYREIIETPVVQVQFQPPTNAAVAELGALFSGPLKPQSPPPPPPPQEKKFGAEKPEQPKQKDRSVDVYHETVRQRVSKSGGSKKIAMSKDVFAKLSQQQQPDDRDAEEVPYRNYTSPNVLSPVVAPPPPPPPVAPPSHPPPMATAAAAAELDYVRDNEIAKHGTGKRQQQKSKAPRAPSPPPPPSAATMSRSSSVSEDATTSPPSVAEDDEEDMPNVRQLRSKFEGAPGSSKSKKFMVMASLTRRGAVAMSKSLQNIDIGDGNDDYIKETKKKKSHSSSKRPDAESVFKPADGKLGVDDQSLFASTDLKFEKRGFSKLSAATSVFNRDHSSSESSSSDRNSTQKKKKAPQAPMLKFGDKEEEQKNKKLNNSQDDEEEEEVDDSNMLWDPIRFVARMYRLPKLSENEVAKNSADAAYVQGFLERLPAGKKKSTLWNSWKKHYFVAQKGFLNVYSDDSCAVILERIELFGGQVDFTDSHILGVQDRRGHYLVLKCPSAEDAQRWERAVRANIGQDFAKTFVTPSPRPKAPSFFTDVLVIDFGGASVRAGIATTFPTLPKIFFPSVMAVEHLNEQAKYFGLDTFAPEVRSRCRLSHPIVPSQYADKYSVDQTALQGILEKIFKDLNLEPSHYQIQLSVPRAFGDKTKIAIASMLFDEFGVKALNMGHQSVFAFYSYSARSGIMVDLGERMDVVPIVDGYKVSSGISRSTVGGSEMRSKLQHYLLGRNYSLTSFIDSFVTRYAVEQLAYMSRHFDRELDAYRQDPAKVDKVVEIASDDSPDAPVKKMELGSERFEACEGLFKPELWGLDQAGVHVLVHKAIKECSMDVRKEVTQSIFLAGGLTLIPGFRERLELEVEKLTPVKPRVHASPYRYHAAYLGAGVHATSDEFRQTRVTRDEWKSGARVERSTWTM